MDNGPVWTVRGVAGQPGSLNVASSGIDADPDGRGAIAHLGISDGEQFIGRTALEGIADYLEKLPVEQSSAPLLPVAIPVPVPAK